MVSLWACRPFKYFEHAWVHKTLTYKVLWQQKLFMKATGVFKLSNSLGHSSRMRFSACGIQVIQMALRNTLLKVDPTAIFINDTLLDIRPRTQDQHSVVPLLTWDLECRNSELYKPHPIPTKGTCYTLQTKGEQWQLHFCHKSALFHPNTWWAHTGWKTCFVFWYVLEEATYWIF